MTDQQLRPPFTLRRDFMENAFERRFQAVLRAAQRDRSWHVVAAAPGSGKSYGISDLVSTSGATKEVTGQTRLPILAVRAPKNLVRASALTAALTAAFGLVPPLASDLRRTWLAAQLARTETELLVVDDAHDLSPAHLSFLKELTDNLAAPPYGRPLGLCLVAASVGSVVPLKELLEAPGVHWRQWRRRLDGTMPYCLVLGHTEEEVREVCAGYEDLYRPQFPDLRLCRWAGALYAWLTHPVLDPAGSKRVTMDHLNKVLTAALRAAWTLGRADVDGDLLQVPAHALTLRHDALTVLDGEPTTLTPLGVSDAVARTAAAHG